MTERADDAGPRGDGGVPLDQLEREMSTTTGGTPKGTDPRHNGLISEVDRKAAQVVNELDSNSDDLPPTS